MRRFLTFACVIFILVMGVFFVVGLSNSNPPLPTIIADEKKIEAVRGSYCWGGVLKSTCVDTISPPMLIEHHEMKPVIVSPESELKIKFNKEPNENTMGATKWLVNNELEGVSLNDGVLIVPKEKGVYVYDVHARWEKGSSTYAFVIEVR